MKTHKLAACLLGFALALTGVLASANDNSYNSSTAGNVMSDSAITTQVKAKLLAEPAVSSLNISAETNNGVVKLSGTVPTDKEASVAIQVAESVNGVKDVDASQLQVQQSGQPMTDAAITAKVKGMFIREKLFGDNPVNVTGINVETKNGVVYLTGHATKAQIDNAKRLAKSVKGVKRVASRVKEDPSQA
jgi:hyperosmotically inducible periplasmic protein